MFIEPGVKTRRGRPIWAADYDKRFCFQPKIVRVRNVERHNLDDGLERRPWKIIHDWHEPSDVTLGPAVNTPRGR
jgi:hypothetical protein